MKQKTININTINQSKQEEIKFIFRDLAFDMHILAENGQQFLLKADTNSC